MLSLWIWHAIDNKSAVTERIKQLYQSYVSQAGDILYMADVDTII